MLFHNLFEIDELFILSKPNKFITCWAQPPENFSIWKDDGVNVIIGPEVGNPRRFTQAQVHQKVKDLGLLYIDKPENEIELERMIADPSCLAISLPDEPDLNLKPYNSLPLEFKAGVDAWILQWGWIVRKTNGRKRHYINFAGPKVTAGTAETVRPYAGQMQKPFVDLLLSVARQPGVEKHFVSADWYPANQNRARYLDTFPGLAVKWMQTWWGADTFEWGSYLECSNQVLDNDILGGIGRAPTPEEVEEQLKHVLEQGVSMISWFSHKFKGEAWQPDLLVEAWDGRSPELRLKCKEIATRLNGAIVEPPKPNAEIEALKLRVDALEFQLKDLSKVFEAFKAQAITSIEIKRGN